MTHSLILEVPENIYQPIAEQAAAEGREIEEIVLERLADAKPQRINDPFEKFIGAFDGGGLDWANKHDEYLGENLRREMRGENE